MVGFPGRRFGRRRPVDPTAPRPLGCFWPLFWLILVVVLLGLLFGGYRKGTKVGAPERVVPASTYSYVHDAYDSEYTGT